MKLTLLFFISAFLQVNAAVYAQKVTYKNDHATVEQLFSEIRKQTGYNILVDYNKVSKLPPLSVDFKEATLQTVLDKMLEGQPLTYSIQEKTVLIKEKPYSLTSTANPSPAGSYSISGLIVDTLNRPISGATVKLLPGKLITASNKDGQFTFSGLSPGKYTVAVSFIGYEQSTKEVLIDNNPGVHVVFVTAVLKESSASLSEVAISTGYQYIKPEQMTGATSTITTKDYESQINTNFLDGLVNKLPGLMINNDVKFTSTVNGKTTSNTLFAIRGISTISGSQNPLIVLDDYPTELSLNDINPNEIESVTILKDAAAAAIYGARASNGVVIIKSKRAKEGATRFAFRTTMGITPKEDYSGYRWAPSDTHLQYLLYAYRANPAQYSPFAFLQYRSNGTPYVPGEDLIEQQSAGLLTQDQLVQDLTQLGAYNNAADYSRLFTQTAVNHSYNLDISGGNQKALYYFTMGYNNSVPNADNNSGHSFQLNGRTTFNFTSKFSLDLTNSFNESIFDSAPVPGISAFYPYEHFTDAAGNSIATFSGSAVNPDYNATYMAKGALDDMYNPLNDMENINTHTHTIDNRIQAIFRYNIGYGFNLSLGGDYEVSVANSNYLAGAQSSVARQLVNSGIDFTTNPVTYNIPQGSFLQQTNTRLEDYTARLQLTYNKQIGKDHSVNAIIGTEVRDAVNQGGLASYFGYNPESLLSQPVDINKLTNGYFVPVAFKSTLPVYSGLYNQSYNDQRFVSGFVNAVYAYKDRYSLTGSIRVDQANLFGTDPRYRYKPLWSLGAAWDISKEDFMKDVSWVSGLKLRLADGFTGNIGSGSIPQVIASSYINNLVSPSPVALNLYSPANSGLRWEQTNSFNAGLDYTLLKRISGSVDYYRKRSTDVMATNPVDPTYGVSSAIVNAASIENQGLELGLHADWISRPGFNWNTGIILARNTSKVLSVYQSTANANNQIATGYIAGYPIDPVFSYRYAGLDNTGTVKLYDVDGKAKPFNTIAGTNSNFALYDYEGSGIPAVNAGMSNRVDIGRFYIYAMINYYGGFKVRAPYPDPTAGRPVAGAQYYWTKPGDENNPNVVVNGLNIDQSYITNMLDKYTVNGDYITLGALTASYNLAGGKNLFSRLGFSNFSILLQGSNLYTRGLNKYNFSQATGSFAKNYLTPTYTIGLYTNF